MNTLKNSMSLLVMGLGFTVIAQTSPPVPPAPKSSQVKKTSSNESVITQNGGYGQGGNTSFSVSNSDDEYRLKTRYPKNRYPAIKKYLLQELGTKGMQSSGTAFVWSLEGDQDTVYKVALEETNLKLELDKTLASTLLISKFEDMGNVLRNLISGVDERQKVIRLEREAARAQRDAARMQQEAERLKETYERDALRFKREAQKLEMEADRLSLVSKRGGGIDGYVREILMEPSTIYPVNAAAVKSWKWPEMQKTLLNELEKDSLITKGEDVVFVKEENGIYVNGEKLTTAMWSKYNSLFRENEYGSVGELSFYKQDGHIAVVSSNMDFENVLKKIQSKGLIESTSKKVTIEINGDSVVKDGKKLSQEQTAQWNDVLHKENVIPAPGKTIIIGADFASMGYSFGKNTLGIWIERE